MEILVADDSSLCRHLLRAKLQIWGYEVVEAEDGEQARQILESENAPRIAILDWYMPALNGDGLCRKLRARESASYTYVILLTSQTENEGVVRGLASGADDYLTKPWDPAELRQRLAAGVRIIELEDRLLQAHEALREEATYDSLTELYNRRAILEIHSREVQSCQQKSQPISLLIIDLDNFKRINDTYGHQTGDEVLREAAKRMRHSLRAGDSIGRYGGEEFIVVLPNTNEREAQIVAEHLRISVSDTPVAVGELLELTVSLGLTASGSATASEAQMIQEADKALYHAKQSGRNQVCRAGDERSSASTTRGFGRLALCEQPS